MKDDLLRNVDEVDRVFPPTSNVDTFQVELGRVHVHLVAEEGCIGEGFSGHLLRVTGGVNGATQSIVGPLALLGAVEGLVVGDEHVDRDPRHVEPVQRVLDCLVQPVLAVNVQLALVSQVVQGLGHSRDRVLNKTVTKIHLPKSKNEVGGGGMWATGQFKIGRDFKAINDKCPT